VKGVGNDVVYAGMTAVDEATVGWGHSEVSS
jgi:hypothetical protein